MRQLEHVSPTRIERLLELSCVYNVPLTITVDADDMTYRYKSRMFEMCKVLQTRRLVIDHPVTDGPAIALVPNTPISVFFALDNDRYFFDSRIIRKITFTLANKRSVSAFEIAYPNVLKSGQRRMFYRVPVPQGKPICVECGIIGDKNEWTIQEPGAWNFPSHVRFEGRILNISVGGMLLAIKKPRSNNLVVGAKLVMLFTLKLDESPLLLKGVIRRVEERSGEDDDAFGIEFIDIPEKFEYKLAINRLYRYVAERQREILASGASGQTSRYGR